ncbi:MAG: 30S ribosomal protein S3 [Candidatus Latescibacteria bacterium]|nr:30S ribosomal protein S3 [Candidatus Latescibacterota bacterium]
MGQKTHPIGFRLGITKQWKSAWFSGKNYRAYLLEDLKIRRYIETKLQEAMIANVKIERVVTKTTITIYTARPGMVFGTGRKALDALKNEIKHLINRDVQILVEAVRVPELEAKLVSENIAQQLAQRVAHRRAMKRAVSQAIRLGAQGIKVMVSGRLAGAEIARSQWYQEGRLPLQTLRADIDYYCGVSKTIYGTIGVKVWIYKGDVVTEARA